MFIIFKHLYLHVTTNFSVSVKTYLEFHMVMIILRVAYIKKFLCRERLQAASMY